MLQNLFGGNLDYPYAKAARMAILNAKKQF